jgi:hypothetical protein
MAVDPAFIDASAGAPAYSGSDLRLGLITPMYAGAGSSLGVRTGIRPSGSGTDLLVQAQSSPNMTVKVNTGSMIVQGAISGTQGAYTWTLDTLTNLTISAAHATLARTDLIAVRIRDATVDTSGQRDAAVIVITGTAGGGTPSLPTDATYVTIAQIAVGAAVTTIVSGNITNVRTFTSALGGCIPCTSTTRPTATAVPAGQLIYETDTRRYHFSDASTWRLVGGQLLYAKRDITTTWLSNQAAGSFLTAFTTATVTVPNTGVGQAYEIAWSIPATNGAFTTGRFNTQLSLAVNGGGFSGGPKSSPVTTNANDTWMMHGADIWRAGNTDTSAQWRITVISVGGNFDSVSASDAPLLFTVRSTGLLASEAA